MGLFSKTLSCFAAVLLVSSLASCGSPPSGVSPSSGTRVIADVWGREVEIPAEVGSIVCLGSGAPRMAAYLGAVDMLAGVEEHDAEAVTVLRDYSPVYHSQIKGLPVVGAGGGSGANNAYPEELIKAMPDVILAGFSAEAADELAAQTAIPVVSVRYLSVNFVDESFYSAMRVFAEVIGKEERCEEVLSYIDGCKADLAGRTADVPDAEKKKAYTGAVTFSGRHGFSGTYANFGPLMGIHALNVADELAGQNYFEADLEKVLEWDPDVIFLDPGNMDLVNDEYRANTAYFNSLRAVSEGQVYTMPSFNNCGTNITYALMDAYYAGAVLFPEQFSDIDIAAKSGEILTELLGKDIFDEMAAGGLYYGPLALGE